MIEVAAKLYVGDIVEMRKPHPCGGRVWAIVRVGADIGLACKTCGRRVLLSRRDFARGVKRFVQRAGPAEDEGTGDTAAQPSPAKPSQAGPNSTKRDTDKRDTDKRDTDKRDTDKRDTEEP